RFLAELGVKVVPLAEAAAEGAQRARETFDCLITPIVKRAAQEREEFHARLAAVTAALQTHWEMLPRVSFPLVDVQGSVFEPHEAEDRLAGELDRRASPQAPDADHFRAELLDQVAQEGERGAGADQVLDEEDLRGRADEPLELDRDRHAPLTPREPLGAIDD